MQFNHVYCAFSEPAICVRSPNANQIQNVTPEGDHEVRGKLTVIGPLICTLLPAAKCQQSMIVPHPPQ